MTAYEIFFIGAGLVGIPAIVLFVFLAVNGDKHARSRISHDVI
jgi:hypothetical protein